jgi:peptidyl-prolyl cis-trans isomerase D
MIVFAFIGTIFYSWGMGGATNSSGGVVATVDGSNISKAEYERTFNNLVNFYREQFQSQFSEELIQKLDLKKQALNVLIEKKILLHKAEKLNIQVSDAEVINQINSITAFKKNKTFNNEIYQNYLKFKRVTPLEFEETQREALLLEKIRNLIKFNVKVSPNELNEAFLIANEKVKLDYMVLPLNHFKSEEKVSPEEIKSFYEKNKERFEVPEKIKIQYVKTTPKDYENQVEIQNEDIEDFYKMKIANFRVQKMYKAAHILFKLETKDNESEESIKKSEEQAKSKADDILKKIRSGVSFKELAKKHSDDLVSGKNGGSLGEFPEGMMVTEFENALKKLNSKETSEPIKTSFGFHIIRLDEVTPERIKPLEEVKEEITKKLLENKTRQKMKREIKHLHLSAKENHDLVSAALEKKMTVQTTSYISKENHIVPDIGSNPVFFNQAFLLEDKKVGEPVISLESAFVMKVISREKSYIPELKDVAKLAQEKTQEKKDYTFSTTKSESFAGKISNGTIDFESTANELGLDLKHTPFFSRSDSIPGIGNLKKVKNKAFELDKGKSGWAFVRDNYYLIRLQDRQKADIPEAKDLKDLRKKIKLEKGNSVFQEWMDNLKESSEILIDKSQI